MVPRISTAYAALLLQLLCSQNSRTRSEPEVTLTLFYVQPRCRFTSCTS